MKSHTTHRTARPSLRVFEGDWVVDLRPALGAGASGRLVLGPAALPETEAIHLAYARLRAAEGERLAEVTQRDLFAAPAPVFFAAALDAWQAQHRTRSGGAGAARYVKTDARRVRRALGTYRLEEFAPPDGNARLESYVRELIRRKLAGRTIRNLVTKVFQVLRHAVARGWLRALPMRPANLPPKAGPDLDDWITEAMFRELRAQLFSTLLPHSASRIKGVVDARTLTIYVERRRCWLSWAFYTGAHAYDASHVRGGDLFLDRGSYIRRNHKSARSIRPVQFMMPPPLRADLEALCALVGRPFYPEEEFTGGEWPNGSRAMNQAASSLGWPRGCNPKALRRSFAREMFLAGADVKKVADHMGHSDTRMLQEVYTGCAPVRDLEPSPWGGGSGAPTRGPARVVQLRGR